MKKIIFTIAILLSSTCFALEGLEGNWCQYHINTGEVEYRMEVEFDGSYILFEQNEDGAVRSQNSTGFISQGVSGAAMETNGVAVSLNEVIIRSSRKGRTLELARDDHSDFFQECR